MYIVYCAFQGCLTNYMLKANYSTLVTDKPACVLSLNVCCVQYRVNTFEIPHSVKMA